MKRALQLAWLALLCAAFVASLHGQQAEPSPKKAAATPAPKKSAAKTTPHPTPKPFKSTSPTPPPAPVPPPASTPAPGDKSAAAPNATLQITDLVEFASQPAAVQQLLTAALALTKLHLTYTYGSADPANGGMDCSGTIYHLLRAHGLAEVPRDASRQYVWARSHGEFFAVIGKKELAFEFSDLLPGDLLFWSGTYAIDRDPPVTHTMIYLGTEKRRKQRVMVGASDGRSYEGKSRWGVSVFDFLMPRARPESQKPPTDFLGYARIPGLRVSAKMATPLPEQTPPKSSDAKQAATPKPTPAARKKKQ